MRRRERREVLERLLKGYFEFSEPVVLLHFMDRWEQRCGSKTAHDLIRIIERSEVCMDGDQFNLYDPIENWRIVYVFKDDGKVHLVSIFKLYKCYRDNWLNQIHAHVEYETKMTEMSK